MAKKEDLDKLVKEKYKEKLISAIVDFKMQSLLTNAIVAQIQIDQANDTKATDKDAEWKKRQEQYIDNLSEAQNMLNKNVTVLAEIEKELDSVFVDA